MDAVPSLQVSKVNPPSQLHTVKKKKKLHGQHVILPHTPQSIISPFERRREGGLLLHLQPFPFPIPKPSSSSPYIKSYQNVFPPFPTASSYPPPPPISRRLRRTSSSPYLSSSYVCTCICFHPSQTGATGSLGPPSTPLEMGSSIALEICDRCFRDRCFVYQASRELRFSFHFLFLPSHSSSSGKPIALSSR
ncbi:hypothetical protein L249_0454 [Ophiocordyceps polyrhachis-furcata BCC 54312]|uniref:Uncharacterized protein n=1 Tax=Ophiocordyceps polyrhachis-furcata BCC 54312 TaxID=1330021 RepID=A0A367LDC4_9HYPO|nr:hypothetical protein L249_0454 [Ophiocordyceps polyrhachis-furcata BCC 54312]